VHWNVRTKNILALVFFACSVILTVAGFVCLLNSTEWGMEKALHLIGLYQHVESDKTDIFGQFLQSFIWTYQIFGILLVGLGAMALWICIMLTFKLK